jgi:uncharacterized membrane protein YgaE (UPF0421/DUF939 family)
MNLNRTYLKLNRRLQSEYREPAWGWGFRVAISVSAPLLWGIITGRGLEAEWMSIAAECVSFIDLKGNVGQRIRLLLSATLLSLMFCVLGSLAGNSVFASLTGMLVVGFLCGTFKNLGDRGLGLTLSIYIFYIVCCSYPLNTVESLLDRCAWVGFGAAWTIFIGILSFVFIRVGAPYRRTIAAIWKSVANLAAVTGKGWDGREKKSSIRQIYLMEKDVRAAIDASLYLFEDTADLVNKNQKEQYALTQSRKSASIVSLYIIQLSEAAEQFFKPEVSRHVSMQLFSLFRTLQQIGERMEVYMLTLKQEEYTLVLSRLERLSRITSVLNELPEAQQEEAQTAIGKIILLSNRVTKLVEHSLALMEKKGEPRVFHAYSFAQTLQILHPKYLKNNLKQLMNFNSFTTRYALRIGISTMVGLLIAILFFKDHGYWIPFTAIIVAQPYFGATLKKGIQRSLGTISGVIVGTAFLQLPFPAVARLILVFVSSVLLIYYLRRQYGIAAFFITLMLVGLLSLEPHFSPDLLLTRIIGTLTGSALAIIAGFVLLPFWDKEQLPKFLAEAYMSNIDYFQNTFYPDRQEAWTRLKRSVETKNSNAYDSLARFMQEPGGRDKQHYERVFFLLTHNVRITRELNNFNSESELDDQKIPIKDKEKYMQLLTNCDDLFRENAALIRKSGNRFVDDKYLHTFPEAGFSTWTPTDAQLVYVEKLWIELKFIKTGLEKQL